MPDITIPDAAVEAAAQVYFGEYGPSISWHSPSMSEEERDTWRDEVTAYLAAAAPHIAAQALRDVASVWQRVSDPEFARSARRLRNVADRIEADHG